MKVFAAISKVENNTDGTITVEGTASSESVDMDGEVVEAAAIEAALPDFMRYGTGNLREMHQPRAAGTIDEIYVVNGVTKIVGTVVDPVAITKVKTGVYKGFSIGGKVTARDKKHVTGLKLVEISLVDRPANPDAVISMWKSEDFVEDTAPASEDFAKIVADRDMYKGTLEGKLDTLAPQIADMAKRLKDVEDEPLPPKTAGKFVQESAWKKAPKSSQQERVLKEYRSFVRAGLTAAGEISDVLAKCSSREVDDALRKTGLISSQLNDLSVRLDFLEAGIAAEKRGFAVRGMLSQ